MVRMSMKLLIKFNSVRVDLFDKAVQAQVSEFTWIRKAMSCTGNPSYIRIMGGGADSRRIQQMHIVIKYELDLHLIRLKII